MGRCFIDWATAVVDEGDKFYEGFIKFVGLLFRLVLNHLGYFNPSALKESLTSAVPRVVALSSDQEDFGRDLNSIDEISAKTGVLQTQFHFHFMCKHCSPLLPPIGGARSVDLLMVSFVPSGRALDWSRETNPRPTN